MARTGQNTSTQYLTLYYMQEFLTIHWLLCIGGVSGKAVSCFYFSVLTLSLQTLPTTSSPSSSIPQQAQDAATGCMKQSVRFLPSGHSNHGLPTTVGPYAESCCLCLLAGKMPLSRDSVSILCKKVSANISLHSTFPPIHTEIEIFACC